MMNETEAALYLNQTHYKHFTKNVTPHTVKRWLGSGKISELTEYALDMAVQTNKIPPKRGRPPRYSECDKLDIIAACEYMSQGQVAKKFGCHRSYVSLIVRGKR